MRRYKRLRQVLRGSYTWHATLAQARQAAKEAEI